MAKHILLVDGNSLAHANHSANTLTVGDMQVQAIFGVLKSLRALFARNPNSERLVLWDGRAEWRIALYPEYKGNRKTVDDPKREADKAAFKRQTPFIEKSLQLLGVRQMRSPLLEADDLAGHLVPRLLAAGYTITLITADQDWLQFVQPGVEWFDMIHDRRVDTENFFNFTGYQTSKAFVQGKALAGDSSDNVTGIKGLGDKGAALFLAAWKDVNLFLQAVDSGHHVPKARGPKAASLHPEQILSSPEGRALFERNLKLMDLTLSRKPEPGEIINIPVTPDPEKFQHLCQRLAFASILRDFNNFLHSFNLQPKELS